MGTDRAVPGSPFTVLLVDDEDMVRLAMRRMLRQLQVEVVEARSAAEARDIARRDAGMGYVLVCDLNLADGDGAHLAAELQSAFPGLRSLLVSGEQDPDRIPPGTPVLLKPFTRLELGAALDALVAGPSPLAPE